MEDIIYIIIGVGWIIFAIYNSQRKLKKKQERARQQTKTRKQQYDSIQPKEKPRSEFDKFFEEISGKTIWQEPEAEQAPAEKKPPQKERTSPYYSSAEYFQSEDDITENASDLSKKYYKSAKQELEEKYEIKKKEIGEEHKPVYIGKELDRDQQEDQTIDFDLRQAVIYSEILNRPYQY